MKKFLFAAVVVVLSGGFMMADNIVVPEDKMPFTVEQGDVVRIPVKGIAGTQVTAKVTGEAKATVNSVSGRKNGKPLIGPGNQEVEVKASAKGKVTVEITITPPTGKATTEKYEFEVK
jgi:hypothetical protein